MKDHISYYKIKEIINLINLKIIFQNDYKKDGIKVKGYLAYLTKEEEVKELIAKIEKDLGVIDILVNKAGIIKYIPMCEMEVSEFKEVIDIDLVIL